MSEQTSIGAPVFPSKKKLSIPTIGGKAGKPHYTVYLRTRVLLTIAS